MPPTEVFSPKEAQCAALRERRANLRHSSNGDYVYVWDGVREPEQQSKNSMLPSFNFANPDSTTTSSSTSTTSTTVAPTTTKPVTTTTKPVTTTTKPPATTTTEPPPSSEG